MTRKQKKMYNNFFSHRNIWSMMYWYMVALRAQLIISSQLSNYLSLLCFYFRLVYSVFEREKNTEIECFWSENWLIMLQNKEMHNHYQKKSMYVCNIYNFFYACVVFLHHILSFSFHSNQLCLTGPKRNNYKNSSCYHHVINTSWGCASLL